MQKTIGILFLFFLLNSCQTTERDRALNLIKEWNGKQILFPEKMQLILPENACNEASFFVSEYKILAYVDSSGCFSCKLQLPAWEELMDELDSVPVLFNFVPASIGEIESILKENQFNYPVCIDEKDSLNKLNHFPREERFQTFLLDKNDKVLAIGNPIYNPKVKELYMKIISGN